jgi:starch phosphorylase
VLSGDHLKSASDLGVPLVAIGLLYQEGYFRQYLNADGWQQEEYPKNDFYTMPVMREKRPDGSTVTVGVDFPGRRVFAQVWRIQVGRMPLFLLDANIDANSKADQDITDELYGGDREMRIKQELMLGIGGMKALAVLGYSPALCHMNEGHSAFLGLERIRMLMDEKKLAFEEALEVTRAGSVFTTHTPVPAGIDRFSPQLMEKYFKSYWEQLGLSREEFLALGRENPADTNESFNMAILALKLSVRANGVSKLHGIVSRRMWQPLWSGVPEFEVPISSVTNRAGVRGADIERDQRRALPLVDLQRHVRAFQPIPRQQVV